MCASGLAPCDYVHPQLAIDAAQAGDTVEVLGGETYTATQAGIALVTINKNIKFLGSCNASFTECNPRKYPWTTLDGGGITRVMNISLASPDIEGFIITHGSASNAGG